MEINEVANALKELGHPTRLMVYKQLVKSGEQGMSVGDLQKVLAIPNSTLSHHISALISAGLIKQIREGRMLFCQPQYPVLNEIISFLVEECCAISRIDQANA